MNAEAGIVSILEPRNRLLRFEVVARSTVERRARALGLSGAAPGRTIRATGPARHGMASPPQNPGPSMAAYRSSKTNSWSGASTASTLSASSASALPPREWRRPWTRTHWSGSTCVPAGASTANPRA